MLAGCSGFPNELLKYAHAYAQNRRLNHRHVLLMLWCFLKVFLQMILRPEVRITRI